MIPTLPENYQEAMENADNEGKLFIIDCWGEWCTACKAMEYVLTDVSINLRPIVDIYSLNIESAGYGDFINKLNIITLPTFIVFKGGEVVERASGSMTPYEMERWLRGIYERYAE